MHGDPAGRQAAKIPCGPLECKVRSGSPVLILRLWLLCGGSSLVHTSISRLHSIGAFGSNRLSHRSKHVDALKAQDGPNFPVPCVVSRSRQGAAAVQGYGGVAEWWHLRTL